jgi:hypothetical protein
VANLSYNTDALQQERIRKGPHEYVQGGDGKMIYRAKPALHQEYPKIMDRAPAPRFSDFKGKPDATVLLEQAMKDWDAQKMQSIVHSRAEEDRWLKAHPSVEADETSVVHPAEPVKAKRRSA